MLSTIKLKKARQNNLKGWDLELPIGRWITVTGVSGSGKSSLALDILYAEGQRRYVETFSPYARQFLERMDPPRVEEIQGIPPALAIQGTHPVRTSRSTVGTLTEVNDFLKILFSRVGVPFCPDCQREIRKATPEQIWEESRQWPPESGPWVVTFPLSVAGRRWEELRLGLLEVGFFRLWVNGEVVHLQEYEEPQDSKVEVVVDRILPDACEKSRFVDSMEAAYHYGKGVLALRFGNGSTRRFTDQWRCLSCGTAVREPSPNLFSFNSPVGACQTCRGFGRIIDYDPDLLVPDPEKSVLGGAVKPFAFPAARDEFHELVKFCRRRGIPVDRPWQTLSARHRRDILEGTDGYYGVKGFFHWLQEKSYKMHVRVFLSRFRAYLPCPDCHGARLQPDALLWRVEGRSLPEILAMDVSACLTFFTNLRDTRERNPVIQVLLNEVRCRLEYLRDVGLSYLTLDRASRTLSGGEVERVLLTRALGTRLVNTLFVLDEPSIGLHPRDTDRLVRAIRSLVDQGNTVVIVEHDPAIIRHSDYIVDLGPGGGAHGGKLIYHGPAAGIGSEPGSLTGRYLVGSSAIPMPLRRRPPRSGRHITLLGVREHNLKGVDIRIPLGLFVCVTGVSGSGKSTLMLDVLYPALSRALGGYGEKPGMLEGIEGASRIDRIELIDQSALGRTSRANPATYTKAWDPIRRLFAATQAAKSRGWGPGIFSFNVEGGRCESCRGEGFLRVEMQFLSDVLIRCPDCGGRRFQQEVLGVTYEGHSIADILEMTVDQALGLFENRLEVLRALEPLHRMGLGYLTLGQPLSTLSGGEAQRLKLARFLARCEERTLFLLDEPTTGMHLDDVRILVQVLMDLVEEGHSVVVIEHHLDVIKCADHVIDLGPEGGDAGGRLVVQGTPEEIATHPESHTGRYLRAHLEAAAGPRFPLAGSESPLAEALPYTGNNDIRIIGAREHNLKDLHVHLPRGKLIAVSGVSGSGKSTLAFDILFAEGQRRYLESLPAYVRQYLKVLDRPEVDLVAGVPPTVAIEQRSARGGRRSTVATLSEIYHFLRLLYARLGRQYCPRCDIPITRGRVEEMIRTTVDQLSGRTVTILAPKVMGRKGFHHRVFAQARRRGIERVRVDGDLMPLAQVPRLDRYREHWIDWVVTDGLIASPDRLEALQGAFEKGLKESDGTLIVTGSGGQELTFSRRRQCPGCGLGFEELDPRHFSFNSPMGACERCEGLGTVTLGDAEVVCPDCGGSRLIAKARAVRVLGLTLPEATAVNISRSLAFWSAAEFPELWRSVAQPVVADIVSRLQTLKILGLGYLTLDRAGNTLSGGEAQRIRLASQIGSNLQGVCYVLDEPTIGLHPRDNERLIGSLQSLRDRGNTVVVVEHDEKVIQRADWIVELGPGPGREGGRLVAQGKWADLQRDASSPTALALADQGHRRTTSRARPAREDKWIRIKGAVQHNLKQIDVELPLGTLICVTGVSGSGKSSLVEDVLFRGLRRHLVGDPTPVGRHERIEGWQNIEKVLKVDHAPIGRTPRSTPATYVKIWDEVRKLFAGLPESKSRGYGPGRFSFNVACGRCPVCRGQGVIKQEMSFLPDVYTTCEACDGLRFNPETLAVTYRRRSAGEVLRMTVDEAADFFTSIPNLLRPLKVLRDLGLGYLTLGQSSPSLSGGEAQRIKLAVELSKNTRGKTLYMLDEPTTGLHLQDVQRLLEVLHRFVGRGDTVVIVEHHLDVIAAADWIVDLGPEGGELGGRLVFQGSPGEILALRDRSHTGKWLARFLGNQSGE